MHKDMIYLDNNATTRLLPSVGKAMLDVMHAPHNPSSIHAFGRNAKNIVEEARSNILLDLGLGRYDGYSLVFMVGQ
jgi:cysteine desulfurase